MRIPTILACVALTFAAAAAAQNIYRYVFPDGRVVYSDSPVPGAKLQGTVAPPPPPMSPVPVPQPVFVESRPHESAWPRALAEAFYPPAASANPVPTAPLMPRAASPLSDLHKLRAEISRLELLVKKLQTELQIERQYNQALELHVRTLTQVE